MMHLYTALSQFLRFVEDGVQLLECSPASCLAPRNHSEEKCEKFITCSINNKSPSHFSFDTCRQCQILKSRREHIFSLGERKTVSVKEKCLFERNTILSHSCGNSESFLGFHVT